ncbi:VC1465 family Xer recombination activation factor [Comamonas aquatilis]|uniref:VC1465 family Xer recombination activation factor n=1 Tax=Comamonas aquatilis TaxID=1778406 RepID=UPI0039EEACB4
MDLHGCAQFLHVSTRTVHNWESGKHDIPYSAYRLLRLLNRMELPGQAWQGWCFYGGKLISPEGRSFEGKDSSWWGLLLMRARVNDRLRQRLGVEGAARTAMGAAGADRVAGSVEPRPTDVSVGRREAPALDLSHRHFRTYTEQSIAGYGLQPRLSYHYQPLFNAKKDKQ